MHKKGKSRHGRTREHYSTHGWRVGCSFHDRHANTPCDSRWCLALSMTARPYAHIRIEASAECSARGGRAVWQPQYGMAHHQPSATPFAMVAVCAPGVNCHQPSKRTCTGSVFASAPHQPRPTGRAAGGPRVERNEALRGATSGLGDSWVRMRARRHVATGGQAAVVLPDGRQSCRRWSAPRPRRRLARAAARASVQEIKREIRSWQSGCRPGDAPCLRASHEFVARFQAHSSRGRMRRICHRGAGMGQS